MNKDYLIQPRGLIYKPNFDVIFHLTLVFFVFQCFVQIQEKKVLRSAVGTARHYLAMRIARVLLVIGKGVKSVQNRVERAVSSKTFV